MPKAATSLSGTLRFLSLIFSPLYPLRYGEERLRTKKRAGAPRPAALRRLDPPRRRLPGRDRLPPRRTADGFLRLARRQAGLRGPDHGGQPGSGSLLVEKQPHPKRRDPPALTAGSLRI